MRSQPTTSGAFRLPARGISLHYLLALGALCALLAMPSGSRAQAVTVYDDFSAGSLDTHRWRVINEEGTDLAETGTANGTLTVRGRGNRTGAATTARLPEQGAVEVDALGWTGTNQILQLYSGDGAFNHFIEFGEEGTDPDGTPILNVWLPTGRAYRGRSPVTGPAGPSNRTTLRIERDSTAYRFLANGNLILETTTDALDNDARVFLYGWSSSVSNWDNVRLSGPSALLQSPADGATLTGAVDVLGSVGSGATSWRLEYGAGTSPKSWTPLASGTGTVSGNLAHWDPDGLPSGPYSFRLVATDDARLARAGWSTIVLARPAFQEPMDGQVVGTSFPVLLRYASTYRRVQYYDNGTPFAESSTPPFFVRRLIGADADGEHTLTAVLTTSSGETIPVPPIRVTVKADLYGRNAHPADNGRSFVFPSGNVGVTVGENDGYTWPGCENLYRWNDTATTDNYVAGLVGHGVNVMRIMLDYADDSADFLENPLGTYNPKVVAFWDKFFQICERRGMTVLLTPWDTFWMNQPWDVSPYNKANGGPCATQADFIRSPEARAWQKARFKYIIDRWGDSPAIFAIDLLNEFDIWWDPAAPEERADWVNEMATFVRDYEFQRWGHVHMLTVSSASANPRGAIGDIIYRHPLFEFANTHQYYGEVNDPKNIIDPALAVNWGVKDSLGQILDGRPYVDSESGPISLAPPWLTNDTPFDDQYYSHMSWAHFASGGVGPGMRWPYRIPHYLSPGMHDRQKALATVAAALDWRTFVPANIDARLAVDRAGIIAMGSADARQALVWLTEDVRTQAAQPLDGVTLRLAGFAPGAYLASCWNTASGARLSRAMIAPTAGTLAVSLPTLNLDMAVTVRRLPPGDVNGDLSVDATDAAAIMRFASGLTAPSAVEEITGDVDADGTTTLQDALHALRRMTGLEAGS